MNEYLPFHMLAIYGFCLAFAFFNSLFLFAVYMENRRSGASAFRLKEGLFYIIYSAGAFVYVGCQLILLASKDTSLNIFAHRLQMCGLTVGVVALIWLPCFVFGQENKLYRIDLALSIVLLASTPLYFSNFIIKNEPERILYIVQGTEMPAFYVLMILLLACIVYATVRSVIMTALKIRSFRNKTNLSLGEAFRNLKASEKFLFTGYLIIILSASTEFLRMSGILPPAVVDFTGVPIAVTLYSLFLAILQMREYRGAIDDLNRIRKNIYDKARKIEEEYKQLLETIVDIQERDDEYTAGHSRRVMEYSETIAKSMGLGAEQIAKITTAGILHDIGKVGVNKTVLNKPSQLTPEEFEEVAKHSRLGSDIISPHDAFGEIARYVLYHHEKLDGSGYPDHISSEQIPEIAKIITVADIFDALSSKRPYRAELPVEKCLDIMKEMTLQNKIDPAIFSKLATIITLRAK